MTDSTRKALNVGDVVRSPAGRLAKVLRIDSRLDEADIELLPARATFRLGHLRLVEATGADDEGGDGAPSLY